MGKNKKNSINEVKAIADSFANCSFKKFVKEQKKDSVYEGKKKSEKAYVYSLFELFPETIVYLVKYSHNFRDEKIKNTTSAIYAKVTTKIFLKELKKEVKHNGTDSIKNIKLFPIVASQLIQVLSETTDASRKESAEAIIQELTEICELILGKKLKKFTKIGIDRKLAFDLLMVVPCKEAYNYSKLYRIRKVYEVLYEYGRKYTDIPFQKIIEFLFFKKEDIYREYLTFALLEKKSKFLNMCDNQKALYLVISNWCFDTMEKKMNASELNSTITVYVNTRRDEDSKGRDESRRYALSTLSEEDYPKIKAVVDKIIANDDTTKKYL